MIVDGNDANVVMYIYGECTAEVISSHLQPIYPEYLANLDASQASFFMLRHLPV
jgi:hypothetical protein